MIVTVLYRLDRRTASGTAAASYRRGRRGLVRQGGGLGGSRHCQRHQRHHFFPQSPITREQLAVIFYRYAQDQGWDVRLDRFGALPGCGAGERLCPQALAWAVGAGLITGTTDTTLSPLGSATSPGGGDPHPVLARR